MSPVLVLVEVKGVDHPRYTRFDGRTRTHQFRYLTPLSAFWVGELIREPEQFQAKEAEQ